MPRVKLKEAIKKAGYTQSEVAFKVNVSYGYMKHILGGSKTPSLRVSHDILRLLGSNDIRLMDKN